MEDYRKYENILQEIAPDLEKFKRDLCSKLVQAIPDRADRDQAVALTRKVFNIKFHQQDPEGYKAGMEQLSIILKKHGSSI